MPNRSLFLLCSFFMASQCTLLHRRLFRPLLMLQLLLLVLLTGHQAQSLEFMDADESAPGPEDEVDSAELPASLQSYSKDTIANFNPHKTDALFRTQWERVPLQKQEVIKRR